jgi:uncharacterized caspase-like protein
VGIFQKVFLLFLAACWVGCGPALAEKRVALVIGNSAYQNVPKLPNPVSDAAAVAEMLKAARFDVVDSLPNLPANELRKALRNFGSKSRDADVAVIYYAGHGIELDGVNYLIPVDATLQTDADVLDETVPLDRVLFAVEPARQLRLIILDACRDNPFAKTMKRTVASRGIGRGLAKVEPTTPNTMIAFAAKAGSTAADGDKNSPFAAALIEYLPKPGLDLRKAFGFVRDDVLKNTGNQQEPYVYGSLGGNDVALVPAKPAVATPVTNPQADPLAAVRRDYELALQLGTRDGWNAFLAQYSEGFYANLAKGQLSKIAAEEARAAAAEKARLAEQERVRLAAERAEKAEQEKAAAAAKAAELARVAAEKAKEIEQQKATAAELARAVAEKAAAAQQGAAPKKDEGPAASTAADQPKPAQQVASLAPETEAAKPAPTAGEIARMIQTELQRVGCLKGNVDGDWSSSTQRSLDLFNKNAGTRLDVKLASPDALGVIKSKPGRVCPLVCDRGFRADGDSCVKITCQAGYELDDEGSCAKIAVKKPKVERVRTRSADVAPTATQRVQSSTSKPSSPQAETWHQRVSGCSTVANIMAGGSCR